MRIWLFLNHFDSTYTGAGSFFLNGIIPGGKISVAFNQMSPLSDKHPAKKCEAMRALTLMDQKNQLK